MSWFGDKEEADEKSNQRRISDQAVLLANIEKIIEKEEYSSLETGPLSVGYNIDSSEISINKLYNFSDFIEGYNKLTPADLSNLTPYIDIYKIYPEEDNEPIYKFPFNNFFPKNAKESILANGSDRGYQAGLVSVELASQGKDTATMFIYNIRINFIFDSIGTLFHENSRYIELFNPPKKHKDKVRNADQKYYQLLLKFGWNVHADFPEIISSKLHPKELAAFAAASSSSVYMNYVKHGITINEDGSVSLAIEYIGSVEAEARNANNINIFDSDDVIKLKEIQKSIEDLENSLKEKESKLQISVTKSDDNKAEIQFLVDGGEYKGITSLDSDRLKSLYEEKFNLEGNSVNNLMNVLMRNIGAQYNGFLSYISINKEAYDKASEIRQQDSKLETEQLQKNAEWQRMIKDSTKIGFQRSSGLQAGTRASGRENKADIAENLLSQEFMSSAVLGTTGGEPIVDVYNIRYFTFGTLISSLTSMNSANLVIATNFNFNSAGDNTYIPAGDFKESDSGRKLYINSGLKIEDSYVVLENKITPINIFDIPISISTFKYWFLKHVTSQNVTSMSLMNFLNLCVNELLTLATRPVNNDYIPKQNVKFKYFFDKTDISTNNPLLKRAKESYKKRPQEGNVIESTMKNASSRKYPIDNIDLRDPSEENILPLVSNVLNTEKETKTVIVFYAVPTYVQRKKDLKKDIKDGIPHFFYGSNNSIANKITFKDEDIPFYKEANIQSQVDRKPWAPGIFLRGKYNVSIETIGTVKFRVGSMFYVSPTFTGVVDPNEPIKYGIGGYFNLVSIKMNIESGKYTTSLEGNWVSTGTGEYTDLAHISGFTFKKLSKPIQESEARDSEESILQELINQGIVNPGESLQDVVNRTGVVVTGSGRKVPRNNN